LNKLDDMNNNSYYSIRNRQYICKK